jgi:hypothetical protein
MRRPPAFGFLAALALSLIAAAPAFAQATTYGGGAFEWEDGPRSYSPSAGVVLESRGDSVAVAFDAQLRCRTGGIFIEGRRTVRLEGTRVRASGRGVTSLVGRDLRFRWSLSASLGADSAAGVITVRGRRGRKVCPRWRKPFDVRVATPPTGALAAPPADGLYVGLSTLRFRRRIQGSVLVRVAADGRRIAARWSTAARCRRGRPVVFTNYSPPTALGSAAQFVRRERFTVRFSDVVIRYRVMFGGEFRSDGAAGVLRLRARIYDRRGRRLPTRCDSGKRRWAATAPVTR